MQSAANLKVITPPPSIGGARILPNYYPAGTTHRTLKKILARRETADPPKHRLSPAASGLLNPGFPGGFDPLGYLTEVNSVVSCDNGDDLLQCRGAEDSVPGGALPVLD